jgi:hypothetical protein
MAGASCPEQLACQLLQESSPLEAAVSFLLGPLMALRAGGQLQVSCASDALAVISHALDKDAGSPGTRQALQRLASGK